MISAIVAISQNYVIGQNNQMIWHLSTDLKRFRSITWGKPVIMGRKTFQSIGKPLPGRTNVVISANQALLSDNVVVFSDLNSAINVYQKHPEAFIIGGGTIYKQTLDQCQKIYLSVVEKTIQGDVYFPPIDESKWAVLEKAYITNDKLPYHFYILKRTQSLS